MDVIWVRILYLQLEGVLTWSLQVSEDSDTLTPGSRLRRADGLQVSILWARLKIGSVRRSVLYWRVTGDSLAAAEPLRCFLSF